MYKQNLHTHCTYCDGKNTIEQMVEKAIELRFDSIGISSHTRMPFTTDYPLPKVDFNDYKKEICALKQKYKGVIDIYAGLEFDLLSKVDLSGYDYLIGSVHYLQVGENFVGFDRSAQVVENIINDYFDGDGLAFAKKYYQTLATLPEKGNFDIVGHFDIITKSIEIKKLFDAEDKTYQNYALEALHALCEKIKVFEVNTGAMARGFRSIPYPMPFILKELKNIGGQITLSSDCHDKNFLDHAFDTTIDYVKCCGFNEICVFKDGQFIPEKI